MAQNTHKIVELASGRKRRARRKDSAGDRMKLTKVDMVDRLEELTGAL